MEQILDKETQERFGLKAFFESGGYKRFKQELDQLILGTVDGLNVIHKGFVDDKKLSELNYKLGKKNAFETVLSVLEGLQEEMQERNSPPKALKSVK